MTVKDKLEKIKKYDEYDEVNKTNKKLDMYSSCPQEPFPYDEVEADYINYDLNITRHPNKWYGIETNVSLNNKLPYNFYVH